MEVHEHSYHYQNSTSHRYCCCSAAAAAAAASSVEPRAASARIANRHASRRCRSTTQHGQELHEVHAAESCYKLRYEDKK